MSRPRLAGLVPPEGVDYVDRPQARRKADLVPTHLAGGMAEAHSADYDGLVDVARAGKGETACNPARRNDRASPRRREPEARPTGNPR